ncbi:EamA family transporter [Agromyces sp. SYSU T00194]|uniref:EamA family transporter n=1 Tax=Agromyces chitinivorans TaxID=3158560 RepID=UPI0033985E07
MRASRGLAGIVVGLAAGLAFGGGGAVVKPLLEAGWSPGAAVFARIAVAAVALAIPGLASMGWSLRPLLAAWRTVLAFALLGVVLTQVAFYAAIERIPVSLGLLIEYLAPVVLVLLAWVRLRRPPQGVVIAGSIVAIAGLVLVIGPGGGDLDAIGLLLAGLAMLGMCVYYVLGERADASVPPLALAASGFVVGALALGLIGLTGILPFEFAFVDGVVFLGGTAPWYVPVLVVGLVSTAFAYVAGITSIRLLGTRLASFLGLSEVIFAAIVAWIVLGEVITPLQMLGGVLILAGIVLVRFERDDRSGLDEVPGVEPLPLPADAEAETRRDDA